MSGCAAATSLALHGPTQPFPVLGMQGFDGGDIVVSHIEAVKLRQRLHTFDGAQLVLCQAKRPQLQVLQIPNLKDQVLGEVQQAQLLIAQETIADVADVVASSGSEEAKRRRELG